MAARDYGDLVGLFNFPSSSDRIAADARYIAGQAQRAMLEGRTVFLARITTGSDPTPGVLVKGTEIIQAVENVGWRLDQMSYVSRAAGLPTEGYFLFRLLPHSNETPSDRAPMVEQAPLADRIPMADE